MTIPVDRPTARVSLTLTTSNPFIPGRDDVRTLGVVVGEVRFEPSR